MTELPQGWVIEPLMKHLSSRSGDSKIIKGKQSSKPLPGLVQGFSASGADVWVKEAQHKGQGVVVSAVGARCGKTFRADGDWTAIANTHVLVPSKDCGLDFKWLWYLTNDESFWIRSGTAQPFVKVKDTLLRPQLIPPIEEQKRIVEALDSHFARIRNIERILLETSFDYDKLLRSILYNYFNQASNRSSIVKFSDFFDVVQPKQSGYKQKEYKENGLLPIVDQGKSLVGGYTDELERRIQVTDALVIFGDHTLCIKYIDFDFALGADGTKILKSKTGVNTRFAYLQLRSKEIRSKGYARHMGELRKEHFWLPSVENQILVAEQVEELLNQLEVARSDLTQQSVILDSLKRSILHKAFTGQLIKEV